MTTIVLINYHKEALTAQFFHEELSKLSDKWNLVVVNNGATTESDLTLAQSLHAPVLREDEWDVVPSANGIYILSSAKNLGFARGNNWGAQFAKDILHTDYLLFSNNDIQLHQPDTIGQLEAKMKQDTTIGMIGPSVVGLDGKAQSPEPYHPFWQRYVWMYLSTPFLSPQKKAKMFDLDYAENATEGYHYKVMGSFFMVRTDDFFAVGGMDPHTFLYSEETILSERLKKIEKKAYYAPCVSVVHAHGATTKEAIGRKAINEYRITSEAYYYYKYRHVPMWQLILGIAIYQLIIKLKK